MRTSALQYLYLQKPVSSIILIVILSILPWIWSGFHTIEETKNTEVATAILESGNWILPKTSTGEIICQPPLSHWLIAAMSLPQGSISGFTPRLPAALSFVVLMAFVLLFFGRRLRFQEAFIAVLLLITCIEIHWAGISANVNMIYTMFMLIGLFKMYRWENKLELKGLPIVIPLMFSGAIMTNGISGIIHPLVIFGCYLFFLRKYSFYKIIKSLFNIALTSLFIPAIWYIEGWRQGGAEFLQIALSEDISNLIHAEDFRTFGHNKGYLFLSPIIGFFPWTLLLLCSLFGLNKSDITPANLIENDEEEIRTRKKMRLFCFISAIGFFLLIFLSGKINASSFLPAYPFIAIFMAQYIIYLTENRSYVTRIFAGILASVASVIIVIIILNLTHLVDFSTLLSPYLTEKSINTITGIANAASFNNGVFTVLFILLVMALGTTYYQMSKKINIKILYATIFLVYCSYLFIDGVIMNHI